MTPAGLWREIVVGKKLSSRILRLPFLLFAAGTFLFLAVVSLDWQQQAVMGLLVVGIALALAAATDSNRLVYVLHLPVRLLAGRADRAFLSHPGASLPRG